MKTILIYIAALAASLSMMFAAMTAKQTMEIENLLKNYVMCREIEKRPESVRTCEDIWEYLQ